MYACHKNLIYCKFANTVYHFFKLISFYFKLEIIAFETNVYMNHGHLEKYDTPRGEMSLEYYPEYDHNDIANKTLYLPGNEVYMRSYFDFEILSNETTNTTLAPVFIEIKAVEKSSEPV